MALFLTLLVLRLSARPISTCDFPARNIRRSVAISSLVQMVEVIAP
jgi:hypothetical protein